MSLVSLYDEASLWMTPSGAKDGKLFSELPVPVYGPELVTNGDFSGGSTGWTLGTGWAISEGYATHTGSTGNLASNASLSNGTKYKVSFEIVSISGGVCNVYDTSSATTYASFDSVGIKSVTITKDSAGGLAIRSSSANAVIDNVSVKEVLVADGDFTFSRGSNLAATRVDANGLIEKGRENLLFPSENTNTGWAAGGTGTNTSSVQTGQQDPNGGTRGFRWTATCGSTISDRAFYRKNYTRDGNYLTLSFWVKSANGSNQTISFHYAGGHRGTINVTNEWQRVEYGEATGTGVGYFGAEIRGTSSDGSADVYLYGWQLEKSLVATDYIETGASTARAGILEDMPRLDYSGSCPSLLLEPQRTNVVSQSEYFGDSSWNNSNAVTRSISSTSSPEGKLNAYDIIPTTANTNHTLRAPNLSGFTSGAVVNVSFFAKANGYKFISVVGGFGSSSTPAVVFNLDEGAIESGTGTIEDYGSGWYRCVSPITLNATALYCVSTILNDSQSGSFAGNGTSAISVYGFQIEQASYPTSYIPTYGTSQTRAEDKCVKTGISSLIGQTEGTIYLEADIQKHNEAGFYIAISDGAQLGNALYVYQPSSGTLTVLARKTGNPSDGVIQVTSSNWTAGINKLAIAYTSTTAEFFINGFSKGTTTFSSLASFTNLTIGSRPDGVGQLVGTGGYKQAVLFPTALNDSECIALTKLD